MTVKFSIVHVPQNDSQELHCYHPDCEPVRVWKSHLVDFEEVRKEVQQHAVLHLTGSFMKLWKSLGVSSLLKKAGLIEEPEESGPTDEKTEGV